MHKHDYELQITSTEIFNPNLVGAIKQIYHVMKGYLRKLPVLEQNFPRIAPQEIL